MMKNKITEYKKPLAVVVVLAILLVGYFTRDKWMSFFTKSDTTPPSNSNTGTNTTNTSTSTIDKAKVLKRGDSGASVMELQRLLNEELKRRIAKYGLNTLTHLTEDGQFGPITEGRLDLFVKVKEISINDLVTKLAAQA